MRAAVLGLVLLLLAGCGGETTQRGSVGWDKGEARLVIKGKGKFQLELDNNGPVPVEFRGVPGWPQKTLAPGTSQRLTSSGAQTFVLTNAASQQALVDYVFHSDGETHIDAVIP